MKFRLPWSTKASGSSVSYTTIDSTSELAKLLASSGASNSGVRVTHQTALQASVALACARVIAQGIAQVPLKLFSAREDGGADIQTQHDLYKVLHDSPNEWQTSFEWREMTALHLVFAGNAYSQVTRNQQGGVVELLPLYPSDVKPERIGHEIVYKVTRGGETVTINGDDILHLRGISWNGFSGLDGVHLARQAIGLSLATEEHGSRQFSNGATIPGILSTEQSLTKDQLTTLRDSFREAQQGLSNAWNIMVTHGGLKFQPTAINNEEAQFVEVRKYQVEEVCRHFGVLPIMVGHSDKAATFASSEQMFISHLVHTMAPWYTRLEQSFNKHLLTDADRGNGLYTKFIDSGMLRGSHKERAEFYNTMFNIGALNPNEVRAREELNPYDGGEKYRVPMNTEDPNAEKTDGI